MTGAWEIDAPYGPQRWSGQRGRFETVAIGIRSFAIRPGSADDQDMLCARTGLCGHAGPWPYSFRFCPECGAALAEPPPPSQETWSAPANGASGLPTPPCRGVPVVAERQDFPMPGPSDLSFIVAGSPPRLFGYDLTNGRLFRWLPPRGTPGPGTWAREAQLAPASRLPRWSWSAAAFTTGFAVPTDDGAAWVESTPERPLSVTTPPASLGFQQALGGAASLPSSAVLPVQAAGGLAVGQWHLGAARWHCTAVATAAEAVDQVFAAPSVNQTEVFWCGPHGQLFARCDDARVAAEYRPWPGDFAPMLGIRPVLSANGVFHQLGRKPDGQQVFEALTPPGVSRQRIEFGRYVTSCGAVSFQDAKRFQEPWQDRRTEYLIPANEFLVPLLQFDQANVLVAICSPRVGLRPFLETKGGAGPIECRLAIAGQSRSLTDMKLTLQLRAPWDVVPFVYAGHLHVYDRARNTCVRWPLQTRPA